MSTDADLKALQDQLRALAAVLSTVLDQVDYTRGNCRANEMVGAVLSTEVIALARAALERVR